MAKKKNYDVPLAKYYWEKEIERHFAFDPIVPLILKLHAAGITEQKFARLSLQLRDEYRIKIMNALRDIACMNGDFIVGSIEPRRYNIKDAVSYLQS